MPVNPAPGELELVRAFVNTWDADDDVERLTGPDALRDWLAEQELLEPSARVTATDHRHAIEVREAIRALLLANAGIEVDPGPGGVLDAAARRARLSVRFDADGGVRTEPAADGVAGAIGRILALVAAAQDDDTWPRLKACPADDCQWAFYDRSRNRSAVWCDMKVCGNRRKVRSYRERHHHPPAVEH